MNFVVNLLLAGVGFGIGLLIFAAYDWATKGDRP